MRRALEDIRASVLECAERRFRGLTATERELLEWTTARLVDQLAAALDGERYPRATTDLFERHDGRWQVVRSQATQIEE
jgi:hypothetical protein